jgi:hypothetical protein
MSGKGKEAVARGSKAAIDSFVGFLLVRGIAAESKDSGPVHSAWVGSERADDARQLAKADRAVRVVSGPQSAYELCFQLRLRSRPRGDVLHTLRRIRASLNDLSHCQPAPSVSPSEFGVLCPKRCHPLSQEVPPTSS